MLYGGVGWVGGWVGGWVRERRATYFIEDGRSSSSSSSSFSSSSSHKPR